MPMAAVAPPTREGLTTTQTLAVAPQFGVTWLSGSGCGCSPVCNGGSPDPQRHRPNADRCVRRAVGVSSTIALYPATLRKRALEWHEEETAVAFAAAASQWRNV
jgi:hypothetical protein